MKRFNEFVAEDTGVCPDCGSEPGCNIDCPTCMVKEDEGAGAPANSAGFGNIAGLGVGKAGKPDNWGEPGVTRKKRQDEGSSDFDYSNDIVTELVQEGLLESAEPADTFAGAPVFDVDMDRVMKSRFGKNRYHRYSRYVGEDEVGEAIRQHGRNRKSGNIVLRDSKTNVMTYLRRKNTGTGIT